MTRAFATESVRQYVGPAYGPLFTRQKSPLNEALHAFIKGEWFDVGAVVQRAGAASEDVGQPLCFGEMKWKRSKTTLEFLCTNTWCIIDDDQSSGHLKACVWLILRCCRNARGQACAHACCSGGHVGTLCAPHQLSGLKAGHHSRFYPFIGGQPFHEVQHAFAMPLLGTCAADLASRIRLLFRIGACAVDMSRRAQAHWTSVAVKQLLSRTMTNADDLAVDKWALDYDLLISLLRVAFERPPHPLATPAVKTLTMIADRWVTNDKVWNIWA